MAIHFVNRISMLRHNDWASVELVTGIYNIEMFVEWALLQDSVDEIRQIREIYDELEEYSDPDYFQTALDQIRELLPDIALKAGLVGLSHQLRIDRSEATDYEYKSLLDDIELFDSQMVEESKNRIGASGLGKGLSARLRPDGKRFVIECANLVEIVTPRVQAQIASLDIINNAKIIEINALITKMQGHAADVQAATDAAKEGERMENQKIHAEKMEVLAQSRNLRKSKSDARLKRVYELALQAGTLAAERGWEQPHFASQEDLDLASPSGEPLIVISAEPITVESAKNFTALNQAGRDVVIFSLSDVAQDVLAWIPEPLRIKNIFAGTSESYLGQLAENLVGESIDLSFVPALGVIHKNPQFEGFVFHPVIDIDEVTPAGPPIVIYAEYPIDSNEAKSLAAILAAGRKLAIIAASGFESGSEKWLPEGTTCLNAASIEVPEPIELANVTGSPLQPSDPRYIDFVYSIMAESADGEVKNFYSADDADEEYSQYAGWATSYPEVNISHLVGQDIGAPENVMQEQNEIDHMGILQEFGDSIAEQAGPHLISGPTYFEARATGNLVLRTPFDCIAVVTLTRNWSEWHESYVTRIGVRLGYVTDLEPFTGESPYRAAAAWPATKAMSHSWPLNMNNSKSVMKHRVTGSSLVMLESRMNISRFFSIDISGVAEDGSCYQWTGDERKTVGKVPQGTDILFLNAGYEIPDSNDVDVLSGVVGAIFMQTGGGNMLMGAVDAVAMHPDWQEELQVIPYSLITVLSEEAPCHTLTQSFIEM